MKLSEIRGEAALDVLAEIMEPFVEICSDPEVQKVYNAKGSKVVTLIKSIIKSHKKAVLQILAILDGEDPSTYAPTAIEIPIKLMTLFNDPAFHVFFPSQGQSQDEASSGSATENTGAADPK